MNENSTHLNLNKTNDIMKVEINNKTNCVMFSTVEKLEKTHNTWCWSKWLNYENIVDEYIRML